MFRPVVFSALVLSVVACSDPFERAQEKLDNPSASIQDTNEVKLALSTGRSQDASFSVIRDTSASIPVPFAQNQSPLHNLDDMLARFSHPSLQMTRALLKLPESATPLAFTTSSEGNIDVASVTSSCSGEISYSVEADLDDLALAGTVVVSMNFNQVVCPDTSVDGSVDFQAEFDTLAGQFSLIELVNGTISHNGTSESLDFALQIETLSTSGTLEMTVNTSNGDSYTLSISGDLFSTSASLDLQGSDGSLHCEVAGDSVSCDGDLQFSF